MTTISGSRAGGTWEGRTSGGTSRVSPSFERSLTQAARAILRLPREQVGADQRLDRAAYWLLVRVSEQEPVRLSELAEAADLDLSTVSREVRDLVEAGLVAKDPDPHDGRASLLSLTLEGSAVLEAASEARRTVLAEAVSDWTAEEQDALARLLLRLCAGLPGCRPARDGSECERPQPAQSAATAGGGNGAR